MPCWSLIYLRADQAVALPVWCLASSARAICDNDNNNHSNNGNLASSTTAIILSRFEVRPKDPYPCHTHLLFYWGCPMICLCIRRSPCLCLCLPMPLSLAFVSASILIHSRAYKPTCSSNGLPVVLLLCSLFSMSLSSLLSISLSLALVLVFVFILTLITQVPLSPPALLMGYPLFCCCIRCSPLCLCCCQNICLWP